MEFSLYGYIDHRFGWVYVSGGVHCIVPCLTTDSLNFFQEIQGEMQPRRERIYQLKQASLKLTSPESEHAANVITRWEKLSSEIQARSGRLQTALETLQNYHTLHNAEELWLTQTEEMLSSGDLRRISGEVNESRLQQFSVRQISSYGVRGGICLSDHILPIEILQYFLNWSLSFYRRRFSLMYENMARMSRRLFLKETNTCLIVRYQPSFLTFSFFSFFTTPAEVIGRFQKTWYTSPLSNATHYVT